MQKQILNAGSSLSGVIRTVLPWVALMLFAGLFSGCGGGSSSSSGGGSGAVPVTMRDSFGNVVTQIGTSSLSSGDAAGDGVATDGIPIANATVVVTDINGKTATATTDTSGYYRVKLTGFTSPLVFSVTNPINNVHRFSVSTDVVTPGKFINTNLSGWTDKIASDVAAAAGQTSPYQLTPQMVKTNAAAISTSITGIATQFSDIITKAGLNPSSFNPLNVPFHADNTGYNNLLYNTIVIASSTTTPTQLLTAPDYVSPGSVVPVALLPGNWTMTVTDNAGQNQTTTESGDYVPTSLNAVMIASLNAWVGPIPASVTDRSITNSIIALTGHTASFTQTINIFSPTSTIISATTITFLSYSGCGTCGVGSSITATWTWTQINNGVGVGPFPTTGVWTRIN